MSTSTVHLLLPEIVVIATAVLIYIAGAFSRMERIWSWIALAGIILSAVLLSRLSGPIESSVLIADDFSLFIRWLSLALGALLLLLNFRPLNNNGTPETIGSLLLVIAGSMLVATANDLILLFVALELISIPTYILLYLGRDNPGYQEAAAKYFFLSVLASVILLYGFSFIYGVAGTMNLDGIRIAFTSLQDLPGGFNNLAMLALLLTFAGLSFRLAAVPFHFYAPDVYQGATNANAALLSVIPKVAGLTVLVRLVWFSMPDVGTFAWQITLAVAILTMTLGNTMALWQDNLRRIMAYSAIAHAGYLLIGLSVAFAVGLHPPGSWDGIAALLFYLCVYAPATLGVFAMLEYLGQPSKTVETVDDLAGMGATKPFSAAMIAIFMLSLTGIPLVAGFWGKFLLFGSALNVKTGPGAMGNLQFWFTALAVIGVLNAAISAGYYLRIVGVMYFRQSAAAPHDDKRWGAWITAVVCALLTIIIFLYPRPLINASNQARPIITQTQTIEASADLDQ
jgi:NADH-quinone oxidoreductase subunit N